MKRTTQALMLAAAAILIGHAPARSDEYRWSGAYAGAHVGYAWGDASVKDIDGGVAPGPFDYSPAGVFGGGTLGYNVQWDRIVVGAEADLGYMDLAGSLTQPYGGKEDAAYHKYWSNDGGLYGDVTARLGFLVTPGTLVYGKGGFAFYDGEGIQGTTKPWYAPSGTGTWTGYAVGGGIEHFISPHISIKVEYLHFGFGDGDGVQEKVSSSNPAADDGTPVGAKFHNTQSLDADSVKLGIAYHF